MSENRDLKPLFEELGALSPRGYAVALHIRFAAPLYMDSTYPEAWQKIYMENTYNLRDPLVFWGVGFSGHCRWSEIRMPDPFGVMEQARSFGLVYGAIASCGKITSRSIAGAARDDREFTDSEIAAIADITHRLHAAAEPPTELTPAMVEALRLVGDGYRHTAAAANLGISESALKARLSSARVRLGARTTAEAIRKAREYGFL